MDLKSFVMGHFVIFVYEGAYFVGKIESICEEGALINSMHQSLKSWKWPEKEDLILYKLDDIKEKIQPLQLIHQKDGDFITLPNVKNIENIFKNFISPPAPSSASASFTGGVP